MILHRVAWLRLWLLNASHVLRLPLALAGSYVALGLLGVPQALPTPWPLAALALTIIGIGLLLAWMLPLLGRPSNFAATQLLERVLGLPFGPLSTLSDRPALGDGAMWREHQARARALLNAAQPMRALRALLTPSWSRPGVMIAGIFLICLAIAGTSAPTLLWSALFPSMTESILPHMTAWAVPPDYTKLPPITLPAHGDITLPAKSHLFVDLVDTGGGSILSLPGRSASFQALDKNTQQADALLTQSGIVTVQAGFRHMGRWHVQITPETPPTVRWSEPPKAMRPAGAHYPKIRLHWETTDAYGVKKLAIQVRLAQRPNVPALTRALPITGNAKDSKSAAYMDLIANPWAGLPVTLRIVATNAGGLAGQSPDQNAVLPAPPLFNPAARAVVSLRQAMALDPMTSDAVQAKIGNIETMPQALAQTAPVAAAFQAAYQSLPGPAAELSDRVQPKLWTLALRIEEASEKLTAQNHTGQQQQQQELQQIIARQKDLLARSTDRATSGQNNRDANAQDADRRRQSGLHDTLDQFAASQAKDGADNLAKAAQAMAQAVQALGQGNDGDAIVAQRQALNLLQQGAGGGGGGEQGDQSQAAGEQEDPSSHDPLGRPLNKEGQTAADAENSPLGVGVNSSARQFQQELRDRAAQRTRPPAELDYINRLLNDNGFDSAEH